MANQGAKKRKEENARHMSKLFKLIVGCNVVYILVRMLFFYSSFTWKHWIGLGLIAVAYYIPYQQLSSMSKPSYDNSGELLDGGFDMSTGGICGKLVCLVPSGFLSVSLEPGVLSAITSLTIGTGVWYMHDVIYITSFVQITSMISDKFWYTYLVIPAFGIYQASGLIKGLLSQGSEGMPEDEKSRKKREKLEKKASRGKFVKTRTR